MTGRAVGGAPSRAHPARATLRTSHLAAAHDRYTTPDCARAIVAFPRFLQLAGIGGPEGKLALRRVQPEFQISACASRVISGSMTPAASLRWLLVIGGVVDRLVVEISTVVELSIGSIVLVPHFVRAVDSLYERRQHRGLAILGDERHGQAQQVKP